MLLFVKICLSIFPFDVWDKLWVLIRQVPEYLYYFNLVEGQTRTIPVKLFQNLFTGFAREVVSIIFYSLFSSSSAERNGLSSSGKESKKHSCQIM